MEVGGQGGREWKRLGGSDEKVQAGRHHNWLIDSPVRFPSHSIFIFSIFAAFFTTSVEPFTHRELLSLNNPADQRASYSPPSSLFSPPFPSFLSPLLSCPLLSSTMLASLLTHDNGFSHPSWWMGSALTVTLSVWSPW